MFTGDLQSQLLLLALGAAGWAFVAWIRGELEGMKARHGEAKNQLEKGDEADTAQTIKVSEAIAAIFVEMKEHRRRIDATEQDVAEAAALIQEVDRRALIHGEQSRQANADVATLKHDVRNVMAKLGRMEILLEERDRRSEDNAAKIDRLHDLFMRGVADAQTRRPTR